MTSTKSRAEKQFSAVQSRAKQVQKEKDKAAQEITEKMARLRGLRLAAEAEDKKIAERIAAEKAAKKSSKSA